MVLRYVDSAAEFNTVLLARQRLVRRTLAFATRYAKRSRDREAIAVADFIRTHNVAGLALPNDCIGVDARRLRAASTPLVFLVPVLSVDGLVLSDSDNGKRFADPMPNGLSMGEYFRSHQAIYWSAEWQLAPLWRSIIVLHEALHAYQHLGTSERGARQVRERAAQALEFRVLRGIGGRRFDELVRSLATRSQAENRDEAIVRSTDATLDKVFGRPISRDDDMIRYQFIERCTEQRRERASGDPRRRVSL